MKKLVLHNVCKLGRCLNRNLLSCCITAACVAQHFGFLFMAMQVAPFTIQEQGKALLSQKWLQHLKRLPKWCTSLLSFPDFAMHIRGRSKLFPFCVSIISCLSLNIIHVLHDFVWSRKFRCGSWTAVLGTVVRCMLPQKKQRRSLGGSEFLLSIFSFTPHLLDGTSVGQIL